MNPALPSYVVHHRAGHRREWAVFASNRDGRVLVASYLTYSEAIAAQIHLNANVLELGSL